MKSIRTIGRAAVAALVAICAISAAHADAPAVKNLVANNGLEAWEVGTAAEIKTDGGNLPVNWQPDKEVFGGVKDNPGPFSGGIFKDTTVKHGGASSVRLESGRACDVVSVWAQLDVNPKTKYQITAWCKGENIVTAGDGAYVWAVYGPSQDYWSHQTHNAVKPTVHDGTFDWTKVQFTVDTNETGEEMHLVLQLRRATGKLWFDDIEVTKLGPATPKAP
ncbi:MAG TPA: hypothetical protein VGK19_07700 [Capsulimonadaceae bacterium]|jgi:hypothetical protein